MQNHRYIVWEWCGGGPHNCSRECVQFMSAQEADSAAESACAVLLCVYLMHRNGGGDGRGARTGGIKTNRTGVGIDGVGYWKISVRLCILWACMCDGAECFNARIKYEMEARKLGWMSAKIGRADDFFQDLWKLEKDQVPEKSLVIENVRLSPALSRRGVGKTFYVFLHIFKYVLDSCTVRLVDFLALTDV